MAGIAALMSKRKKRQQKRNDTELSLQLSLHAEESGTATTTTGIGGFNYREHHSYTTSTSHNKEAPTPSKIKRASAGPLKNSLGSRDWSQKTKQSQLETPVKEAKDPTKPDDGSTIAELAPVPSYSAVYIGLVLFALGLVISFVGLGDKGFKTLELKLIGPVLCIIGFSCVVIQIIHCSFPRLFQCSSYFKKVKRKPQVDQSILVEKGITNGHVKPAPAGPASNKSTPQVLSPRVTLHSAKRSPRPRSTIPNYIEDSSDDDDFDPGRAKPHTNRLSSYEQQQSEHRNEILLTPKSLML